MKTGSVFIVLLPFFHCGCVSTIMLVNAVDATVPRAPKADTGTYSLNFVYEGKEPKIVKFRCEQFYNAQASTRGNYWTWREEGEDTRSEPRKIAVEDEQLGSIQFTFPSCKELKDGRWSKGIFPTVIINGELYFHVRSKSDRHTYKLSPVEGVRNDDNYVTLNYACRIEFLPSGMP